jgi:hypothetical protein
MILPADVDLLGADGWAIVVSYDGSGHVSDEDANSIDYAELLSEMQGATRAANDERKRQGFELGQGAALRPPGEEAALGEAPALRRRAE